MNFWKDLQFGARLLRTHPGFTLITVLTLAIGIGANTAIFSVAHAVLLRPLPFHEPDSLYLLTERMPRVPFPVGPSYQNYVDWKAQAESFEKMGALHNATFTMTGAGEPERLQGQRFSADLLPVLGVKPELGRGFRPEEDQAGGMAVVMLGHGLWERRFGSDPRVLGRSIVLNNQPHEIIGVLPASFRLIVAADVVVPFGPWAAQLPDDRSWHPGIMAFGRLKPGMKEEQARTEMALIGKRLEQEYPLFNTGVSVGITGLREHLVQNVRPALLVLSGAVGLVLLIACGNVANLTLARAIARRREVAVRTALGASRWRVMRQLLAESVLLATLGGVAGVALAWLALTPLVALAANSLPETGPIQLDASVLAFAAAVTLLSGVLFGIAPALETWKLDLRSVLNEAARGSTVGGGARRLRTVLVTAQIALALMLLVGSALLLRSFAQLQDVPPGFHPENLLVADVPLSPVAFADPSQRMDFFDRVMEGARNIPGVQSAGAAVILPVSGSGSIIHFNIQGRPPRSPHDYVMVGYRPVSPDYLQTLGTRLIQGRMLSLTDTERGPFVAVVNEAMERQFFPGESALGKRVQLGTEPDEGTPVMEIVGVVGNMKSNLAAEPQSELYLPYRQANVVLPVFSLSLVLRTATPPMSVATDLRRMVRNLNPDQPVVKVRTMEENIATSVSAPRFRTVLLGIFAGNALLLAVIGLYGLMVYSVTQRVQEIGIRMTLGAGRGQVMRMVLGQGLKLTVVGVAAGIAGALLLTRALAGFLFGISATDPLTYAGVAAVLVLVALVACYVPARRATSVDPMVALRYE